MFQILTHFWKQSFFLPKPSLTEENLPDQSGRVFIVTGGYAGVGKELCKILYSRNGTVYIAGRSLAKAENAIASIKQSLPSSKGKLEFMNVDLGDFASIKPAAEIFIQKETRLDVLVNNAGVMFPPTGSKDSHGHELQVGTNCLGPFLLTQLLTPLLERTAASSPAGSVRVSWAASFGVDALSPKGGVTIDNAGNVAPHKSNNQTNYGATKAANYFLAHQFALRHPVSSDGKGIVSLAFNPGNLKTELQRHSPAFITWVGEKSLLFPAVYGAYTELWAGWSPDVKPEAHNGGYVWPWGRLGPVRNDVEAELKDGGKAEQFWKWCEKETKTFA